MADARELLRRARAVHDGDAALATWPLGTAWMKHALELERGPLVDAPSPSRIAALVAAKYALCSAAALVPVGLALTASAWWLCAVPLAFYGVECQLVFVVPAALTGAERPFRTSRELVHRAGGTARVLPDVIAIALEMLAGGFCGRGFKRSWRVGCLAVVLWFERVDARGTSPAEAA